MSSNDEFYLTEVSPKDKPWDRHKAASEELRDIYRGNGFDRYATRIQTCSEWLKFALQLGANGEMLLKLNQAFFCRVRHCPICQWRRTLKWKARFHEALPKLLVDYPTSRFLFLTLTVRNCELNDLRSTLAHMNKSWERLSKLKAFPSQGWLKSTEVTRSQDGTAHPHFHCLLMVPAGYFSRSGGYLSQAKWTEMWQRSLRADYTPIVDVRAVKPRPEDSAQYWIENFYKALSETLKYSIKEQDLVNDAHWVIGVTKQLHNTRSVSTGGIFREYISESDPEDLINTELGDDKIGDSTGSELVFGWRNIVKKYVKE